MKISDLPPGLKELAELRMSQFPRLITIRKLPQGDVRRFHWSDTPEGYVFWREVNEENFAVYYGCRVTNCRPKIQNLKHL